MKSIARLPRIAVTTADQSAARDAAAISGGIPSRALMRQAGNGAAAEITRRYADRLSRGVAIFAGPGNNGGDAWVIAGALHAKGIGVRVCEAVEAKTDDARAERALVVDRVEPGLPTGAEGVVIDGLLGTGSTGSPRGAIAEAIGRIAELRARGAQVVALDIPSGIDATTGVGDESVVADLTLTFGTIKRGLLMARGRCGAIALLDIGLGQFVELDDGAATLVDASWVRSRIPPIPADAHKGTRRRVVIIGGGEGMVGASLLASRSAILSGAGLVRLLVAPTSLSAAQSVGYDAIAGTWPETDGEATTRIAQWGADAVLLGPGLGRSDETRALVERVLRTWRGPTVLDADALNVFEGDAATLGALLAGRPAIITPHVAEFSRLSGVEAARVIAGRFDVGIELARQLGAVVLLKGVPTVLTDPGGESLVSAAGTPALAVAGSGDILAGIAVTLAAQIGKPLDAAACAAWIHGRAGELAGEGRTLRGLTLDDVMDGLSRAWSLDDPMPPAPVLIELPRVGEDG